MRKGLPEFLSDPVVNLSDAARELAAYNRADLLAAVAALQLMPANAGRLLRLHALAAAAAGGGAAGGHVISASRLCAIANAEPFGGEFFRSMEDPPHNLLAEPVSFFGGDYLVAPGV